MFRYIITDQMANSFGYIRSIREYGKFEKYNKYQIQIVRISNKWDTSKFNNLKLKHFYNFLYLLGHLKFRSKIIELIQ